MSISSHSTGSIERRSFETNFWDLFADDPCFIKDLPVDVFVLISRYLNHIDQLNLHLAMGMKEITGEMVSGHEIGFRYAAYEHFPVNRAAMIHKLGAFPTVFSYLSYIEDQILLTHVNFTRFMTSRFKECHMSFYPVHELQTSFPFGMLSVYIASIVSGKVKTISLIDMAQVRVMLNLAQGDGGSSLAIRFYWSLDHFDGHYSCTVMFLDPVISDGSILEYEEIAPICTSCNSEPHTHRRFSTGLPYIYSNPRFSSSDDRLAVLETKPGDARIG